MKITPEIAETMRAGTGDSFIFTTDQFTGHIVPPSALRMSAMPSMQLYNIEQSFAKAGIELRGPYYIAGTSIDTTTHLENNEYILSK